MNYYFNVLRNYTTFNGRAIRSEFWYYNLINLIILIILSIFGNLINTSFIVNIYSIIILLPTLAVGFRRMHDLGKNGCYIFIPIYNLILACTESENRDNIYGLNPKVPEPKWIKLNEN